MVAKEPASAPVDTATGDDGGSPERNPLAIVPSEETQPPPLPPTSVGSTKREEVESKIVAWEAEEIAIITSRFQRQKAIIDGWEGEQVEKATAWLKKVELWLVHVALRIYIQIIEWESPKGNCSTLLLPSENTSASSGFLFFTYSLTHSLNQRKLEEKRARAMEKMQNEVAVARQKAEERRAEAEAKRDEKLGKVTEIGKVMKFFGRDPSKRFFFKP